MRKGAAIGIGIFLVILVIGGLFAYSYTQLSVSLNDVKFHSIDWTTFSWTTLLKLGLNTLSNNWLGAAFDLIDGVNLNLIFGLSNGGLLPVYIPDLSYDILVNGVTVGKGHSNVNITISPGQTKEITSFQNIKKSSLSPAVYSIVGANGVMELKVKGTAYFKLLGLSIPIPFESSKQISIYNEIKNKLSSEIQRLKPAPVKTVTSSVKSFIDKLDGNVKDLNLNLPGTIIDNVYRVGPGTYRSVSIDMPCTGTIQGGFIANAALGDDIKVYFVNQSGFNDYKNGERFSLYYQSGQVEYGTFDVSVNPDMYYVIMSNTFSSFSTKTVQLEVAANCG